MIDAVGQVVRCTRCGEEIPIPLGRLDWVGAVLRAFGKAPKECGGRERTCWFSTPVPKSGRWAGVSAGGGAGGLHAPGVCDATNVEGAPRA